MPPLTSADASVIPSHSDREPGGQRLTSSDEWVAYVVVTSSGPLREFSRTENRAGITINYSQSEDLDLGEALNLEEAANAARRFLASRDDTLVDLDLGPDW